ncbi:MAG: LbtU family siderophore porin [Halochromatium sp.]|uniref:LbtU family siderophore porin n=1 Tax=Halochromatium sp. TaxID=2049430 RepID=UPI003979358B
MKRPLSWAIAMVLGAGAASQATAQTLEERVRRLEQENRQQAADIAHQKQQLEESPQRDGAGGGGWFENVDIGGVIEIEGVYVDPAEGSSESDLELAKLEFEIAAQVTDWLKAEAVIENDDGIAVDVGMITLANPAVSPLFFSAGQFYVPFGAYETNLISGTLTEEIGETREHAAQVGFDHGGFSGSVYTFNGDNKVNGKNRIESWGANLAFAQEHEGMAWGAGAGYINDLGDSDNLQGSLADNRAGSDPTERTGGWTANLSAGYQDFNLIAEYLSAAERFDPDSLSYKDKDEGALPAAWNIELGYSFDTFGKESVAAIAYQGTREAVNLELPEERWSVGWSIGIFDNTALSFEYAHDTDYSTRNGGTGDNSNAFITQLAIDFF